MCGGLLGAGISVKLAYSRVHACTWCPQLETAHSLNSTCVLIFIVLITAEVTSSATETSKEAC